MNFKCARMSMSLWGIIPLSLIGTIFLPKYGGDLTTVPCCPRTRPHTNYFYCFSRDEATLQEGVAVCLSVMLLERVCNASVFWPSWSDSWPFIGDWDKDQFKWKLCLTLQHLFEFKEPLQHLKNIFNWFLKIQRSKKSSDECNICPVRWFFFFKFSCRPGFDAQCRWR